MFESPRGWSTISRIASSTGFSVTTSITRPASEKAALLYEKTSPGAARTSSSPRRVTKRVSASSPRPVSTNKSPDHPPVCCKSSRTVTRVADSGSASERSSGTASTMKKAPAGRRALPGQKLHRLG